MRFFAPRPATAPGHEKTSDRVEAGRPPKHGGSRPTNRAHGGNRGRTSQPAPASALLQARNIRASATTVAATTVAAVGQGQTSPSLPERYYYNACSGRTTNAVDGGTKQRWLDREQDDVEAAEIRGAVVRRECSWGVTDNLESVDGYDDYHHRDSCGRDKNMTERTEDNDMNSDRWPGFLLDSSDNTRSRTQIPPADIRDADDKRDAQSTRRGGGSPRGLAINPSPWGALLQSPNQELITIGTQNNHNRRPSSARRPPRGEIPSGAGAAGTAGDRALARPRSAHAASRTRVRGTTAASDSGNGGGTDGGGDYQRERAQPVDNNNNSSKHGRSREACPLSGDPMSPMLGPAGQEGGRGEGDQELIFIANEIELAPARKVRLLRVLIFFRTVN